MVQTVRGQRGCLLGLFSTLVVTGAAASAEPVSDIGRLAELAAGAEIVLLGEVHDNPHHHRFQADAIETLAPTAIVFEMLTNEEAGLITPEVAADPAVLAQTLDWANSGWPDFAMYGPLLAFGATLPVFGAEVPRDEASLAFAEGAAAVFGETASVFGLDIPLDDAEQAEREAGQMAAHCDALPEDILPGFVEAQRLRDAMLAQAALEALDAHGAPVAVITGNGHARRDWGVPAILAVARPDAQVFALGQFEAAPAESAPFDAWNVADPVDRPDPCAAFR